MKNSNNTERNEYYQMVMAIKAMELWRFNYSFRDLFVSIANDLELGGATGVARVEIAYTLAVRHYLEIESDSATN